MIGCLNINEGNLPVRYLGVPLISKKLVASDCSSLLEKISGRINSWLSKHLSFTGRLQLLSSILYSIQVYWMSIFILPKRVIRIIEQKFNRFLWNGNEFSSAKAKVAWDALCMPKGEGGLGLRKLVDWNEAAILRHLWYLFNRSGSLWVAWVHTNLIKGRNFWLLKIP